MKQTHPQPLRTRRWPRGISRLDDAHIMREARHREISRIVATVAADQHSRVRVDAKEVGRIVNALDLLVRELGQTRPTEALLFAHGGDSIDHQLWVVAVLREDGMHEPAKLQQAKDAIKKTQIGKYKDTFNDFKHAFFCRQLTQCGCDCHLRMIE